MSTLFHIYLIDSPTSGPRVLRVGAGSDATRQDLWRDDTGQQLGSLSSHAATPLQALIKVMEEAFHPETIPSILAQGLPTITLEAHGVLHARPQLDRAQVAALIATHHRATGDDLVYLAVRPYGTIAWHGSKSVKEYLAPDDTLMAARSLNAADPEAPLQELWVSTFVTDPDDDVTVEGLVDVLSDTGQQGVRLMGAPHDTNRVWKLARPCGLCQRKRRRDCPFCV